ncbi:hypothetical protein HRbin02_01254 [Candidatus Calditenuaceae archaeon HR02]|nr:hypothetical protein HRbin02_01254 [Candidatus Calditenuaceae archaeon HR02]
MSKRREVDVLLTRSRQFLETAEHQYGRGFYDLAAFSLEQSLQLYLKAKLVEYGVDYPRTHSVRRLLELLGEVLPSEAGRKNVNALVEELLLELGMLEDAYITSRYFLREFRREEVEKMMTTVRRVMELVR